MRFSSLFLLLAACGGSVSGSDGSQFSKNDDANNADPNTPRPFPEPITPLTGAFDLSFRDVSVTPSTPNGQTGISPSTTTDVHVDLGTNAAKLTGRWGATGDFTVTKTDKTLQLDGKVSIGFPTSDVWKSITIDLGNDGGIAGTVRLTGEQQFSGGDYMWSANISGTAKITRDTTPPEVRYEALASIGPEGKPLPWDRFMVRAAEPVGLASTREQLRVSGPDGDSLAVRWIPDEDGPGAVRFTGTVDDWTRAASGEPWHIGTGDVNLIKDSAGLHASSFDNVLPFSSLPVKWGKVQDLTGDDRCESGTCTAIGPTKISSCSPSRLGFAGTLERGATGHIQVRYRVLAKSQTIYGEVLSLEVAANGGDVKDVAGRPDLHALGTPIGEYGYASDWTTLDHADQTGQNSFGFAVVAGGVYGLRGLCGGPPPPDTDDVLLLVDSVKSL